MSPGDLLSLVAVLCALIAMVGILAKVYVRRLAFLERKLEITAGQTAEKAAQYAARNTELEQRVRVLERIATAGGIGGGELALQIEQLRDRGVTAQ
ncbi:hypothetical protein WSK_4314 [Novosphingobium sp. Rr 2-17]|uniref:hypothetical protein n=1 Tax=Novosphingobium sp. Rr 2-17 TaxID=555793 RepID=UPI0002697F15|nr:hypothetical protein [Novosphingobium sp. Rr 2-17]EIZ77130.1 hypothetical protein WSK_4314 [Novosphingobium sp. Rr 2-17]